MVPAPSDKVPRVSPYSGCRLAGPAFAYGAVTPSGAPSQASSASLAGSIPRSEPRRARAPVCPPPLSLAATHGIEFSFSSSPYLDVSVRAVPPRRAMCSPPRARLSPARVSPFGHPRILAYVRLPVEFRCLSRPSSALSAKASTPCSSSLNLFPGAHRAPFLAGLSAGSVRLRPLFCLSEKTFLLKIDFSFFSDVLINSWIFDLFRLYEVVKVLGTT